MTLLRYKFRSPDVEEIEMTQYRSLGARVGSAFTVAASMSGFLLSRGNFDSLEVFVFVFLAVSVLFINEYPFGKDVPI